MLFYMAGGTLQRGISQQLYHQEVLLGQLGEFSVIATVVIRGWQVKQEAAKKGTWCGVQKVGWRALKMRARATELYTRNISHHWELKRQRHNFCFVFFFQFENLVIFFFLFFFGHTSRQVELPPPRIEPASPAVPLSVS